MAMNIGYGTGFQGCPMYHPPYPSCPAMHSEGNNGSKIFQYTIQPGDTLWNLAQRFQTTVDDIESLNPGIDPYTLQVGQVILIDPPFGWGWGGGFRPWFGFGGPWFGGPFVPWI